MRKAEILPHHATTLRRTVEHFEQAPEVTGLILGGSIAHGFCSPASDIDVMIVVSDEEHRDRLRTGRACFFSRELCTYEGGYVDGKYVSGGFLREVAARGSEPARYAFKDAQVLFSSDPSLSTLLERAARYPVEDKASRIVRFQAQFEAWRWYTEEALKRRDMPLLRTAVSKLTLFGGRIVLAHNELLYPYHKWFLRVLEAAPDKPAGVVPLIQALATEPTSKGIEQLVRMIREYKTWDITEATWSAQFMQDSELNWLNAPPPIDDL
ncbi:nucleotidyltransferase domain-containing protein [Sorangium sp. So ce429]